MSNQIKGSFSRTKQNGAVLLVALVFLLIITTLAVTNMREVALDSRITSSLIDHKRLFNAAEAGLADGQYRTIGTMVKIPGEYSLATALRPLNATATCANTDFFTHACFWKLLHSSRTSPTPKKEAIRAG